MIRPSSVESLIQMYETMIVATNKRPSASTASWASGRSGAFTQVIADLRMLVSLSADAETAK